MSVTEQKYSTVYGRDMSLHGAFPDNDFVTFSVTLTEPASHVTMVIHGDGWGRDKTIYREYPLEKSGETAFTVALSMADLCRTMERTDNGLFYYHYRVEYMEGTKSGKTAYFGGEEPTRLQLLGEESHDERQLYVFTHTYTEPQAWREGVIYHIFVDRFAQSRTMDKSGWQKSGTVLDPDWENGVPQYGEYPGAPVANNVFFGGDLYGVAENLPYIAALGVKTLYLSPIFDAASNHKYDTGDYLRVDAMFGGDAALRNLVEKAGSMGIRILLDGVFNHTGSDSVYFNREGHYPSVGAYQSKDSPYADWYTFRHFPDEYDCWWGVKILPRLSSDNPSFRAFLLGEVIPKWMDMGVYGWRLDVADELSDSFLSDFRVTVRTQNPDSVVIGEVWEDATDKISYNVRKQYFRGRELDGVMNYPLRKAILTYLRDKNADHFRKTTERLYRRYPKWASDCQMNFLGTHDTIRILTALGGEAEGVHTNAELANMCMAPEEREAACKKLILAYAILAAMPGVPSVFYGDEAGLEGYHDPFCRRPFPWHRIEPTLLTAYREIGITRLREPLFRDGEYRVIQCTPTRLTFVRTPFADEAYFLCIVVNLSDAPAKLRSCPGAKTILALPEPGVDETVLAPMSVRYLRCPIGASPEDCQIV